MQLTLGHLIDKMLCSERLEVTVHDDEDFGFTAKDSQSGELYGTKIGYPIQQFTPNGLAGSKGKGKYRPGLIMIRVFKVNKHCQRGTSTGRATK